MILEIKLEIKAEIFSKIISLTNVMFSLVNSMPTENIIFHTREN